MSTAVDEMRIAQNNDAQKQECLYCQTPILSHVAKVLPVPHNTLTVALVQASSPYLTVARF